MKQAAAASQGLLPLNMQSHIPKYYLNKNPKVLDVMRGIKNAYWMRSGLRNEKAVWALEK